MEKIWLCEEICPHDRWSGGVILHITDCHVEKILHMRNVKKLCGKLCVQCMVFCRILHYFSAESVFFFYLRCFVMKYISL